MRISDWSSDVCSSDLAQTPAEAGQAAVTDTPPTDAPDASADAATDAAAPAPSDVEAATEAPVAQPPAPAPDAATTTTAEAPAAEASPTQPAARAVPRLARRRAARSEEDTSELQSLMRNSDAAFCLKKKKTQ